MNHHARNFPYEKYYIAATFATCKLWEHVISSNGEKNLKQLWRNLLHEHANCVTWVSVTVRTRVKCRRGRSLPPQEQKLEALGTIIAEDGLTVLSLNKVDPTASILSRLRSPGCFGQCKLHRSDAVLMQDGTEVPAKLTSQRMWTLISPLYLPIKERKEEYKEVVFFHLCLPNARRCRRTLSFLDEVVSIGKLRQTLYRQSTLRRGWVNAVIDKAKTIFCD